MKGPGFLSLVLCVLVVAGSARAQGQGADRTRDPLPTSSSTLELGSIKGRVLMPEGAPFQGAARLTLQSSDGAQYTVYTDYQGQFDLPGLTPGNYVLEVDADRARFEPTSQSVQVFRGLPSVVSVSLKYKAEAAAQPGPPAGMVVSAAELDRNVPEKARKEFRRGSEAAQAGKTEEAIAHLRNAVRIYPDFLMARNDLGVQLMAAGRLEEAAEQLRLAAKLDPKSFNPQLNLGIVLVQRHEFAEATQALDSAVSLNPQSPGARLYAGQAHAALGDAERAEKELKAAYQLGGARYAAALFHLGNLYLSRGEREQALKSFEAYLAVAPDAANAAEVRKLIGMIR